MDTPITDRRSPALRVLDLSTVLAGPNCARYLADFGADVIKVEHPDGDTLRRLAWRDPRDGEGLWWKLVNRNKRTIVLDLKDDGRPRRPARRSSTTPTCSSRTSGPARSSASASRPRTLLDRNPRLVITRVTGFGQDGPYANRPGFATVAEGMSGFAALNGAPGRPAAAAADRPHRRGHRARRRVRDDGRAPLGRRSGRRRQPARVDAADDGSADQPQRADRRAAAAPRRRPPLHRAARHLPVPRREVGGGVDEQRQRRGACARAARRRRRRTVRRLRRTGATTATSSRR